jgi:hypothetical protein
MPKRKRNLEGGAIADPNGLKLNVTDMEFDEAIDTPTWVVVKLVEI